MNVNTARFKELLNKLGENSIAQLAIGSGLSISLLEKVSGGRYQSKLHSHAKKRICEFFKVKESELFPQPKKGE